MDGSTVRQWRMGEGEPQHVAVFRALQLGDLLCAVPALRALRRTLPRAQITLIGLPWARDFADRFDLYIDDLLEFPGFPGLPERPFAVHEFPAFLRRAHRAEFDLAIQLHGSGEFVNPLLLLLGAKQNAGYYVPGDWCPNADRFLPYPDDRHEVRRHLALMEFLGAPACGEELEFPLKITDRDELDEIDACRSLSPGGYVCLHPGARYASRRWGAERYAALGDELADRGYDIVITGSASEIGLADELAAAMTSPVVNLAGRTTLGALAALLSDARLLVSNDTGVSHVATGLKVPSVVIVTGSDPRRWAPLGSDLHPYILHRVDCQPCEHVTCPIGHPCATELSPKRVLSVVEDLLERTAIRRNPDPDRAGFAAADCAAAAGTASL